MSKVVKSPTRSPRNNLPKLSDEKIAQEKTASNTIDGGACVGDEVKIENGNNDIDAAAAIADITDSKILKTTDAKAGKERIQKGESSKRKLGDDDEDEEFFGFELGPLKDFNKVKKHKENTSKPVVASPAGGSAMKNVPTRSLTDPIYQEPFKNGWKRELVLRSDNNSMKLGDVYYISPSGKRLRNRGEISNFLKGSDDLSADCFVFAKETIGGPPDQDFVRQAIPKGGTPAKKPIAPPVVASPLFPDPNIDLGKRKPKPKLPKGASPEPPSHPPRKRTTRSPSTSSSAGSRTPQAKQNENDAPKPGKIARVKAPSPVPQVAEDNKRTSSRSSKVAPKSPPSIGATAIGIKSIAASDIGTIRSPATVSKVSSPKNSKKALSPSTINATASTSAAFSTFPQPRFATNFFSNVSIGYDVLLNTFQYLKVQELLRASCVCRLWNQTANHTLLWKTVRMKNSQVNDWSGLVHTLKKNSTRHLDLRKMLSTGGDEMWQQFTENVGRLDNLESIDLCRCSTSIVESLFESNPTIRIINALALRDNTINLANATNLKQLQELRLRSNDGLNMESDLTPLAALTSLKHLSLTFVNKLSEKKLDALKGLINLESLELGECNDFPIEFATEVLPQFKQLERLRLEKGQQECCTFDILNAIAELPRLTQLELINFDIKMEFDEHIAKCGNLRKVLLIPTYVSQSAATNNMVLKGMICLSATLTTFVWAVTQELLKVTELYVDQCDDKKDKKPPPLGESIPILKPVPCQAESDREPDNTPSDIPAQVEIVPLSTVENILHNAMPNTKLKIMKIPFVNTWRQTMVDL